MKIRPVGAELFHADGQTYMTKLVFAFRNFANAPKKAIKLLFQIVHNGYTFR
jgi:hypothetical protein